MSPVMTVRFGNSGSSTTLLKAMVRLPLMRVQSRAAVYVLIWLLSVTAPQVLTHLPPLHSLLAQSAATAQSLPTAHEPLHAGRQRPLVQMFDAQSLAWLHAFPTGQGDAQGRHWFCTQNERAALQV